MASRSETEGGADRHSNGAARGVEFFPCNYVFLRHHDCPLAPFYPFDHVLSLLQLCVTGHVLFLLLSCFTYFMEFQVENVFHNEGGRLSRHFIGGSVGRSACPTAKIHPYQLRRAEQYLQ